MSGDMSQMPLTGRRVVPSAAEKLGFQFRYPHLQEALEVSMSL
jgi:NAD dependent epimerase/dehydratase family enzyme